MKEKTLIAIMSYNRHESLLNCITSIETNIPDPHIAIFDDSSDDVRLTGYLETLAARYRVFRQSATIGNGVYLGGLHANMNWALDIAEKEGFEYVRIRCPKIVSDETSCFLLLDK